MGTIRQLKKWNEENNCWYNPVTLDDKKKSISIASYGTIIHDETASINLILLADGCRVENHSHDAATINNRKACINNVISYFEKRKLNYKIELLLVDNDAPLAKQSELIANHIDRVLDNNIYETINFIGFSKCGCMGLDMMKYLKNPKNQLKTNIFSVSSPYLGTLVASPKFLELKVREIVERRFGKNFISDKIISSLMDTYFSLFSNSHMDLDIAIENGVPERLFKSYDPTFLKNIFSKENLDALQNVNFYQNICTKISDETFKYVVQSGNFAGLGLLLMNEMLYDGKSDGLVKYDSQSYIDKELSKYDKRSITISSVHNTLFMPYYTTQLMDLVHDNIESTNFTLKRK